MNHDHPTMPAPRDQRKCPEAEAPVKGNEQSGEQPLSPCGDSALPRTEKERHLCEVVAEVLGADRVHMTASFGQLGGDSIKAMMVAARLKERDLCLHGINLRSNGSLREVAAHLVPVDKAQDIPMNGLPWEDLPEDVLQQFRELAGGEENLEAVFYLPFEQRAFYDRAKADPTSGAYNVTSFQPVPVAFTEESFRRRARAVTRCHAALRSVVAETDFGLSYQVVLKEREPSCFYQDLRHLADGGEVPGPKQTAYCRMYLNFYVHAAKDLAQALMPHFICFRISDDACLLGYSCTHVFIDGWSDSVLMREFTAPDEPVREDMHVPYFMARYHKRKTGALRYWTDYLRGVRMGEQVIPMEERWWKGTMDRLSVGLGKELSDRLMAVWAPRGVSDSMLMQYLIGRTLCELTGRDEVLLLIAFACRGAEVDREDEIVGNLSRLYPLRCGRDRSLRQYRDDLWAAEENTAPSTAEIFGCAGIWGEMVVIQLTTDILPGHENTVDDGSFSVVNLAAVRDNLVGTVVHTADGLGVRLDYNTLMLSPQQAAAFGDTMIALAQQEIHD